MIIIIQNNYSLVGGCNKPYGGRDATIDLLDLTKSGITVWGQPQMIKRDLFFGIFVLQVAGRLM